MLAKERLSIALLALFLCSLVLTCEAKCGPGEKCDDMEESARQRGFLGGAFNQSISLGASKCGPKQDLTTPSVKVDSVSGRIMKTLWIGADDKIVVTMTYPRISTQGSVVWRSTDYGATGSWNDYSVDFQNALMQVAGRNTTEFTGIVDVFTSEANPAYVFYQGLGGYNWISRDFGATVKAYKGPAGFLNFMGVYTPNPVNADYLMAMIPRDACMFGPDDPSCVKDLYVSFDFGESWGNVTANSQKRIAGFWEASWGMSLEQNDGSHGGSSADDSQRQLQFLSSSKDKSTAYIDKTILASVYEDLKHVNGMDKWEANYDKHIHFVRSDDWFGSKHEKIFSCGNIMRKIGGLVYLVAPASCSLKDYKGKTQHGNKRSHEIATDDDHAHLYVSEDNGRTFKEVCLPVALASHHFAISPGDANGAIVTAIHGKSVFAFPPNQSSP